VSAPRGLTQNGSAMGCSTTATCGLSRSHHTQIGLDTSLHHLPALPCLHLVCRPPHHHCAQSTTAHHRNGPIAIRECPFDVSSLTNSGGPDARAGYTETFRAPLRQTLVVSHAVLPVSSFFFWWERRISRSLLETGCPRQEFVPEHYHHLQHEVEVCPSNNTIPLPAAAPFWGSSHSGALPFSLASCTNRTHVRARSLSPRPVHPSSLRLDPTLVS